MTLLLPFDCLQYIGDVGNTVVRYKLCCTCKELNRRMQKYKHVTVIANKLGSKSQFGLSYYHARKFRGDTTEDINELLGEYAGLTNWDNLNIVLNEEEPSHRDYTMNRCYIEAPSHSPELCSGEWNRACASAEEVIFAGRFIRRLEMDADHRCDTLYIMSADEEKTYLKIDAYSLLDFEAYESFERSRVIPLVEKDYVVNRYRLIIRVDRKARLKAKYWYGSQMIWNQMSWNQISWNQISWNQMSEEEKQPWREKKLESIRLCRSVSVEEFINSLTNNAEETNFNLYWIPEKNEFHVVFPLSVMRE